jgi:hypothetical protein
VAPDGKRDSEQALSRMNRWKQIKAALTSDRQEEEKQTELETK